MGNYSLKINMKFAAIAVLATTAAARHHRHHRHEPQLLETMEAYEAMNEAQLLESRGDADAAVAKTAAIKNIQKALTVRILKRLDDGQPLVEVARKMKAIEGMQP